MVVGIQKAWSLSAGSNGSADSNINWQEGQLAPSVNNSARAEMAAVKAAWNQLAGGCTYGGSSNAYTITSDAPGLISTAYAAGMIFMLKANHTNSGAATLNVDGVGAVAIKTSDGGDALSGDIVQNGLYLLAYNATGPRFDLIGTFAGGSFQPLDATLTAFAALVGASGQIARWTGVDTFTLDDTSALGRALWNYVDPGADRILFWDDSVGAFGNLVVSTGLTLSGTNLTLDTTGVALTAGDNAMSGVNTFLQQPIASGVAYKSTRGSGAAANTAGLWVDIDGTTYGRFYMNNATDWVLQNVNAGCGLYARVATSAETSGTLSDVSANAHIAMTGNVTLNNSVYQAGDKQTYDPGTSARTFTRGAGVTMYVNGTNAASATLAANQLGGVHWRSASVVVLAGAFT